MSKSTAQDSNYDIHQQTGELESGKKTTQDFHQLDHSLGVGTPRNSSLSYAFSGFGNDNFPSSVSYLEDDEPKTTCQRCLHCACGPCMRCEWDRCCSHCYFLFACCCFMISSSSPRLMTILDFIFHVVAYVIYMNTLPGAFWDEVGSDFEEFRYKTSALDLLVMSLVRFILLFIVFAYKRQLSTSALITSFFVSTGCIIYSIIKVCVVTIPDVRGIAVFSLVVSLVEQLLFALVRRRRIVGTAPIVSDDYYHEDNLFNTSSHHSQSSLSPVPPHNFMASSTISPTTNSPTPSQSFVTPPIPTAAKKTYTRPGRASTRRIGGAPRHGSSIAGSLPNTLLQDKTEDVNSVDLDNVSIDVPLPMSYQSETVSTPNLTHTTHTHSDQSVPNVVRLRQESELPLVQVNNLSPCTTIPTDVLRLADNNSLFITFEGVVIHYKFSISPSYQAYFASLDANGVSTDPSIPVPPPGAIMMHGFGSSAYTFDGISTRLGDSVCATLSFDRPGFGLSARLSEAQIIAKERAHNITLRDKQYLERERRVASEKLGQGVCANIYSEDQVIRNNYPAVNPYLHDFVVRLTFALAKRHGLMTPGFTIIGHHSGAVLACKAALADNQVTSFVSRSGHARKQVVRGLILIAPTLSDDGFPQVVRSLFSTSLGKTMVQQLLKSEITEVALRRAWYDPKRIPAKVFRFHKATSLLAGWHESFICMAAYPGDNDGVLERLETLSCPILLIHGDNDKIISPVSTQRTAKCFSSSNSVQILRVPKCGHLPQEEYPSNIAHAIYNFMNTL